MVWFSIICIFDFYALNISYLPFLLFNLKRLTMRHLLGFIVIVLLVATPSCKYFKSSKKAKNAIAMAALKAKQDSTRVADSIRLEQARLLEIENARAEADRLAEEQRLALETKYNIIVGSFITPQYAVALNEEYIKMGYKSQIVKMEGGRFDLVAAEGHKSFRKAVERLKEFQDTVQPDAWMYIKK